MGKKALKRCIVIPAPQPAKSHSGLFFPHAFIKNPDTNVYHVYRDMNVQVSTCACKHHVPNTIKTVARLITSCKHNRYHGEKAQESFVLTRTAHFKREGIHIIGSKTNIRDFHSFSDSILYHCDAIIVVCRHLISQIGTVLEIHIVGSVI